MNIYDVKIPALVPTGEKGVAKVVHFNVDRRGSMFTAIHAMQHGPSSYVAPGTYAELRVRGQLMMTDTDMERRTNSAFVRRAHGRVLVAGLGLGLILFAIADKPEVEHITVVEKYQDVIDLVGPAVKAKLGDRLDIICADILTWEPPKGAKWNVVYNDIWATICTDNLGTMGKLHRRFARRLDRNDPECWMSSWMKGELLSQRRRNSSRGW